MKNISVLLKTGGHCIQTAAKNELRLLTDKVLQIEEDDSLPETTGRIELLTEFLQTSDFSKLRTSDPRLAGIDSGEFILRRGQNGKILLESSVR